MSDASGTGPNHATTVSSGTLIMGTYEIERLINSGGMGEVYRGRNIHNDEPVAIKIVLPSLAHDPKIVALFQKESTTLSRLSHEAIVRYHVFTVDPMIGRPCMVMEFVSGTAMSDRIEQGPMPVGDVRVMLRRVASGLDKAHRAGVVHRDLSPDNVILEEGQVEHAKLIDFGIAKSTALGAGTLLQGQFAGKFNWVSPEQLGAFGGAVDGRSDIYSLALVTAAASKGEVLPMGASIVDAVGKRAGVPDLTGVDTELVPLLSWMLQPDPAARPASMGQVMAAVDNPALVPQIAPPTPKTPDPNRTVIGGALPIPEPKPLSIPPIVAVPVAEASVAPVSDVEISGAPVSVAPISVVSASVVPPAKTSAPVGATVISAASAESEDVSPFGAPSMVAPKAASMPEPLPVKNSKSGLIAVVALLALGGGAAGAYFGGVFDGNAVPAAGETQAQADARAKAELQAEADAKAAQDAAAAKTAADAKAAEDAARQAEAAAAAKQAADEAAAKQAADEAAAKLAADQAAAQQAADQKAAEEAAIKEAADKAANDAKAAADAEAAKIAADAKAAQDSAQQAQAAAAAKQAADVAAAKQAADAEAAKLAEEAAAKKAAEEAAAKQAAAAQRAAKEAAAKKLADEAAAQKAEAAAKADPMATQLAYLAGITPPLCTLVTLKDAKPSGFGLEGYTADSQALAGFAQGWKDATNTTPDLATHQINAAQCPLLDFANRFPAPDADPLTVVMASSSEVVKSGANVSGKVEGLEGRDFALFIFSEGGGATNLKPWTTIATDGTATFEFKLTLEANAPPAPQILVAMVTDKPLPALDKVPAGVTAQSLMPFLEKQLEKAGVKPTLGFAYFRLEN
ncbi:hypothetical protein GCM10010873_10790 [Cypionkella aquatica]|uniref:Protein kinase domain-containing protein n=1 Tax=Cypionkella aquatica TaxID=1756042 RepID=A0AA37X0U3_9RHOB|nr:serine/threonine protein kinase [Cypionkella aquatica]GLS86105.1 hypothetical protein GCM10010873_10790 [Cypionkella aquatica]